MKSHITVNLTGGYSEPPANTPRLVNAYIDFDDLEDIFAKRVEWHFDIAAEQVVEQYTKLPEEVLDVLIAPLTSNKEGEADELFSRLKEKYNTHIKDRVEGDKSER